MARKISSLSLLPAVATDDNDRIVGVDTSKSETIAWTFAELVEAVALRLTDLSRTLTTGLIDGGIVSLTGDPARFDLAAGVGIVVDNTSDPMVPTVRRVTWPAQTVTLANPASDRTYVAINAEGAVVQQGEEWTDGHGRDLILLARLAHVDGVLMTAAMRPNLAYNVAGRLNDLADAIGPLNVSGNKVTPLPGSLQLARSAGTIFRTGANYVKSKRSPNTTSTPAISPMSWLLQYQDGKGGWKRILNQTTVNPNQWDDGTGKLASVPNKQWTIQRLWFFSSGITVLMPGQQVYTSLTEAAAARSHSGHVYDELSFQSNAVFLGWLMVCEGATDLADRNKAVWVQAGKFGA